MFIIYIQSVAKGLVLCTKSYQNRYINGWKVARFY